MLTTPHLPNEPEELERFGKYVLAYLERHGKEKLENLDQGDWKRFFGLTKEKDAKNYISDQVVQRCLITIFGDEINPGINFKDKKAVNFALEEISKNLITDKSWVKFWDDRKKSNPNGVLQDEDRVIQAKLLSGYRFAIISRMQAMAPQNQDLIKLQAEYDELGKLQKKNIGDIKAEKNKGFFSKKRKLLTNLELEGEKLARERGVLKGKIDKSRKDLVEKTKTLQTENGEILKRKGIGVTHPISTPITQTTQTATSTHKSVKVKVSGDKNPLTETGDPLEDITQSIDHLINAGKSIGSRTFEADLYRASYIKMDGELVWDDKTQSGKETDKKAVIRNYLEGISIPKLSELYGLHQGTAADALLFLAKNFQLGAVKGIFHPENSLKAIEFERRGNIFTVKVTQQIYTVIGNKEEENLVGFKPDSKALRLLGEESGVQEVPLPDIETMKKEGFMPICQVTSIAKVNLLLTPPAGRSFEVSVTSECPALKYLSPEKKVKGVEIELRGFGELRVEEMNEGVPATRKRSSAIVHDSLTPAYKKESNRRALNPSTLSPSKVGASTSPEPLKSGPTAKK